MDLAIDCLAASAWQRRWEMLAKATLLAMACGAAALVAFLPLRDSFLILIGCAVALAVVIWPFWGLVLAALAVPFGGLVELGAGGIDLMPVDALVAGLVVGWMCLLLAGRERKLHFYWPLWPVVFFTLLIAFDLTLEPAMTTGLKEVLRWAELLLVALASANLIRTRRHLGWLLAAVLAAGLVEALIGWYQFFLRVGPQPFVIGLFLRAYGTFGQPNPFAGYLIMVLPLAIAPLTARLFLKVTISRWWTLGGLAVALVVAAAVVFSMSRGAWMGLAAAGIVLLMFFRGRLVALLPVAVGLAGLILLSYQLHMMPAAVEARIGDSLAYFRLFDVRTVEANGANWAVVERMASWQAAWGMFESSPVLGVGPGRFNEVYRDFAVGGWLQPLGHAHNYYLNTLAEMGVLGLASYLTLVAGWMVVGVRLIRRAAGRDGLYVAAAAGAFGALVAAGGHNVFDDLYVKGMNVQMGLLVGITLAVHQHWRPGRDGEA